MTVLTYIVVWLNVLANACASVLLAPIAVLPGWLSATLVAAGTGASMLLVFKYTSNQLAISRVRRNIQANMLALSLFRDSMAVALRCQGRMALGAGRLMLLAIRPMLVMCIPVSLLLGQLAAWYQARPLHVGEETVITVHVQPGPDGMLPDVRLAPCSAVEVTAGPVRVAREQMICWGVTAREAGYHRLVFETCDQTLDKTVSIGDGFMRVSRRRPPWQWTEVVIHPSETPLPADSTVHAIDVEYPQRQSWTAGSNSWLAYWFGVSMVCAFIMRPLVRVHV